MSWLEFMGVCLGFGTILLAPACAIGAALTGVSPLRVCQLCCKLAVLQFAFFMGGWLLGIEVANRVAGWTHWANVLLLTLVAVRAFWLWGADRGPSEMPSIEEAVKVLRLVSDAKLLVLAWGFFLASLVPHACSMGLISGATGSMLAGVGILAGYRFDILVVRRLDWVGACILLSVVAYNFLWVA